MVKTRQKAATSASAAMAKLQSLSSKDIIIKRHRDQFGLSSARVKTLWEHYLQFIVVKTFANDSGPTMKLSTSPEVDEMWHTHLLKTDSYRELMELVNKINPLVKFIDHNFENENDPEEKKGERRRAAAEAYKDIFKEECEWFKNGEDKPNNEAEVVIIEDEDDEPEVIAIEEEGLVRIPMSDSFQIFVRMFTGKTETFQVCSSDTVWMLKRKIKARNPQGLMPECQRLIYGGKQLEDDRTLIDYKIEEASTLHLNGRLCGC